MIHVGGYVYIKMNRSEKDHTKVDAYGKVVSINTRSITVEVWWKEGVYVERVPVRVPRDYIVSESEG